MDIFNTVYKLLNPTQIGIQAGQDVANVVLPRPQWILTPYTEERMKQIDPAKYQQLAKEYGQLQDETTAAYQQALNPIPAIVDIGKYALIVVVAVAVIMILSRKGK